MELCVYFFERLTTHQMTESLINYLTLNARVSVVRICWILTSFHTGSRGVKFVRKNYPSNILSYKIHNHVIWSINFPNATFVGIQFERLSSLSNRCISRYAISSATLKIAINRRPFIAINRRPFFRGRLTRCPKGNGFSSESLGNASNASSQQIMSVVFRKEN